jgi:hypothetical protein
VIRVRVVGGWVGLFSWVDELMDECSCAVQVVFCLPQKRQKKIPRVAYAVRDITANKKQRQNK